MYLFNKTKYFINYNLNYFNRLCKIKKTYKRK